MFYYIINFILVIYESFFRHFLDIVFLFSKKILKIVYTSTNTTPSFSNRLLFFFRFGLVIIIEPPKPPIDLSVEITL